MEELGTAGHSCLPKPDVRTHLPPPDRNPPHGDSGTERPSPPTCRTASHRDPYSRVLFWLFCLEEVCLLALTVLGFALLEQKSLLGFREGLPKNIATESRHWARTHSAALCLSCAGIKGVRHLTAGFLSMTPRGIPRHSIKPRGRTARMKNRQGPLRPPQCQDDSDESPRALTELSSVCGVEMRIPV